MAALQKIAAVVRVRRSEPSTSNETTLVTKMSGVKLAE
jgi:hypothetical protein